MGHCPEERPDLPGTVRPEYEFQGCSPGRGLQYPGGRPADRDQAGGSAGSPHHQGGDAGGGDPLRHRDHPVQRVHQGYHQDPAGGPERPAPRHHAERLRYQWRAAGADHPFHRDHPGAGEQKGGRWHQEGHEVRCGGIHRRQRSVYLACAGVPLLLTLVWQRP